MPGVTVSAISRHNRHTVRGEVCRTLTRLQDVLMRLVRAGQAEVFRVDLGDFCGGGVAAACLRGRSEGGIQEDARARGSHGRKGGILLTL